MLRAGFALILAIGIAPAMHGVRAPAGAAFAIAAAAEAGIGAAIGVAASVLYDGAYAGGRALDDYAGIRGSVPNAQFFAASAFGRIWSMLFCTGFFLLGGYRIVIPAFAQSFERLPPGTMPAMHDLYAYAIALPASIVEAALLVAGPAIAIVFAAQATLGALSRVIPRFAGFTLSFPIVFGLALIVTLVTIPVLFAQSGLPWMHVPFLGLR